MNETTIKTRKVNVYHLDLVALREGKTYRFPQGPFTKREHVSRNGGRNPVGKDYAFRFAGGPTYDASDELVRRGEVTFGRD